MYTEVLALAALLIAGETVRIITGRFYRIVIEDSKHGAYTGDFLKDTRQKLENCVRLNIQPENIGRFVEHEMEEYTTFGIRMHVWDRLSKVVMHIYLMLGIVLAFIGSMNNGNGIQLVNMQVNNNVIAIAGMTVLGALMLEITGQLSGSADGRPRAVVMAAYHLEYQMAHRNNMKQAASREIVPVEAARGINGMPTEIIRQNMMSPETAIDFQKMKRKMEKIEAKNRSKNAEASDIDAIRLALDEDVLREIVYGMTDDENVKTETILLKK